MHLLLQIRNLGLRRLQLLLERDDLEVVRLRLSLPGLLMLIELLLQGTDLTLGYQEVALTVDLVRRNCSQLRLELWHLGSTALTGRTVCGTVVFALDRPLQRLLRTLLGQVQGVGVDRTSALQLVEKILHRPPATCTPREGLVLLTDRVRLPDALQHALSGLG